MNSLHRNDPLQAVWESLLAKLYDGVTASNGFQDFIDSMVPAFNIRSVAVNTHHVETHEVKELWQHGISPDVMKRYALEFSQEDMLAHHITASPIGHFYASNLDVADQDGILQSRFFREWVVPQGMAYAAGAILLREGSWITNLYVQRSPAHPPFSREEMDSLDRLMPHLQRAFQMRSRFIELQLGQDFLAGGLDLLAMPVLFFDEYIRVAYMNKRAREMLSEIQELRVDDGHLIASQPAVSRKLNYELGNAIQASRGGRSDFNEVLLLPRTERLPLMLMVQPIRASTGQTHGAALLFVFDPDRVLSPKERVSKLFGLTDAEARLSVALCRGRTLDDIASERGVSPNTLKTQLKSIFAKTGTNRQTELVSLLLASPAYFLADTDHTSPD